MLFRTFSTEFICVWCFLELLGQNLIGSILYNHAPGVLRQHCTGFFMCNIVWRLSDNIPQGFYSCNVAPIVLLSSALFSGVSRTTLHVVLVVQFCPRSIKTVLIRIFFCAISFETSRTTMHKILFLWKFVEPQRQRYIGFFVQYYFESVLRQYWAGFFSSAVLPGASWATLPWIFVCLMLSQVL